MALAGRVGMLPEEELSCPAGGVFPDVAAPADGGVAPGGKGVLSDGGATLFCGACAGVDVVCTGFDAVCAGYAQANVCKPTSAAQPLMCRNLIEICLMPIRAMSRLLAVLILCCNVPPYQVVNDPSCTQRRKYACDSRVVNDPSNGPAASRSATGTLTPDPRPLTPDVIGAPAPQAL